MSSTQDTPMASAAAHAIPQQPVQDADLADQLRHVATAANRLGCPDVADILGTLASTTGQVVFLPDGARHYRTSAFAVSWGAWDHLTAEDGWKHRSWYVDGDGHQVDVPAEQNGAGRQILPAGVREHRQKDCARVTVFPPNHPREES